MIGRIVLALAAASALGSCEKPIRCNAEGYITGIDEHSASRQDELRAENTELLNRRTQRAFGTGPEYDPESLKRAKECPAP